MKRIIDLSHQWDKLDRNLIAQQSELEALDACLINKITLNEDELRRQATLQAYEAIQHKIREAKENTKSLLPQ